MPHLQRLYARKNRRKCQKKAKKEGLIGRVNRALYHFERVDLGSESYRHSLDKNEAKGTHEVGEPRKQSLRARENR